MYSKKVQDALDKGEVATGDTRLAFIRESVAYFEARLPRPTPEEYAAISKKFCDEYPVFRNTRYTNYWVIFIYIYNYTFLDQCTCVCLST